MTNALEFKNAEVTDVLNGLAKTFEEFKSANDNRLKDIESKGAADVVTTEKVDRINDELTKLQGSFDEMAKKANRAALSGENAPSPEKIEYKQKYAQFLRKGDESGLGELQAKALAVGVDADGGYAVPEDLDRSIDKYLVQISPIRQEATVIQVGNGNYKKLVNIGGTTSGWVAETDARTETNTPQLTPITPPLGEIYANPATTQAMLDDSMFDVEAWLASEVAEEFTLQENTAFVTGNGTNKPKGFLGYTTSIAGDATRTFQQIQATNTGVAGGWAAANPSDALLDLIYQMKSGYRNGAKWFMENTLIADIRKFKDADGNYLWKPGIENGQPSTILGYPIVETPDMPVKAANSLSVCFANMKRGYTITDRMGTRVLRDPYTHKPYVHFYTTKRVGGAVMNDQCFKLLKFAV